jgi:hypothetical protein
MLYFYGAGKHPAILAKTQYSIVAILQHSFRGAGKRSLSQEQNWLMERREVYLSKS